MFVPGLEAGAEDAGYNFLDFATLKTRSPGFSPSRDRMFVPGLGGGWREGFGLG